MTSKLKYILISVALCALCSFALLPLFHAGYFTMHDDEQIGRLEQMFLVLSQGQIPPRWIPDLGFGFGYPLFNFYPPLVYYLGSLFHFFRFSFIDSTKLVMGIGFLLSATAMFVWAKKHFGIIPAFFAALLYTYAPYHSVDIYVRGALSEFFAWIWIPAIFWSLDMLFETLKEKYIVVVGFLLALLMLSHSLVMLQFAPFFCIYVTVLLLESKKTFLKKLLFVSLATCIGLGLSAYFWIPSIAEKQYTLVDTVLTKELANYAIHFVCPIQLWSSPWGYGGSAPGCVDGLSFQIGKIQILVSLVGIILSALYVFKRKNLVSCIVSIFFLGSVFMTLSYSKFIWDLVKPFWYIQFPWRFLLFVNVASAFLGGYVLFNIQKKLGVCITIVAAILLSLLAVYQVRNYFKPQAYRMVTDKDMTSQAQLQWHVSSMSYEYVPKEVATKLSSQKTTILDINQSDFSRSAATSVHSMMTIWTLQNLSYIKQFKVHAYTQGVLQINTYAFPGWQVFINGKRISTLVSNRLDLIQVVLPKGQYDVIARFANTPIRTIANTISILTCIGLLIVAFWGFNKKYE